MKLLNKGVNELQSVKYATMDEYTNSNLKLWNKTTLISSVPLLEEQVALQSHLRDTEVGMHDLEKD